MNNQPFFGRPSRWSLMMLLCIMLLSLSFGAELPSLSYAQGSLPSAPPGKDSRFGIVEAYKHPAEATSAGVGWARLHFSWPGLQKQGPGELDQFYLDPTVDDLINRELNAGRQLVGLLIETPAWAGGGSPRDVPNGLYLPYNDPGNLWGQFVAKIVGQYQGKIDHWIMWNEPDICHNRQNTQSWHGTAQDYAQLLKVGYQAAKSANPNAKVIHAATTYWWDSQNCGRSDSYLSLVLQTLRQDPAAAANNGFFDIVALNLYYDPEQIHQILTEYRQLLSQYGFSNTIWLTETNTPPTNDAGHSRPQVCFEAGRCFHVTLENQSFFLVQAWSMALAAGAQRVESYKMSDDPQSPPDGPYGIIRHNTSLRPAFYTYRNIVTYLGGFQSATLTKNGDVRQVVMPRGSKGTTTVVWNMGSQVQTVQVPATSNQALLVDPFGPLTTIRPVNGQYTLRLPVSPQRPYGKIGGRPLMIVEGAGADVLLERVTLPSIPSVNVNDIVTASSSPPPVTSSPTPPPAPTPTAPSNTPPPPPASGAENWNIPGGHFFTQTANGQGGFSVIDDGQARFWSEFQRLGGLQTVGYPISRRYQQDGFTTQAFQKLILQWRPEVGQAWPVNVFDELSKAGFDNRLLNRRQTPLPLPSHFDPVGASWPQIVNGRQALLNGSSAIRSRYFSVSDPLTVFGLPTSRMEDMGNHIAIRTQRAVFQQWKEAVPWAAAGQVTIANGGSIAQELDSLPSSALVPEPVR